MSQTPPPPPPPSGTPPPPPPPPGPPSGPTPPPGGYRPAPGYAGAQTPQTDGLAIGALCCAIGSFVVCPVIPAIVALVLASNSSKNIKRSGGRLSGDGLNTAARIVAWINIGLWLLFVGIIVIVAIAGGFDTDTDNDFDFSMIAGAGSYVAAHVGALFG